MVNIGILRKIRFIGINEIDEIDIAIAKEIGCKIKLLAISEKNRCIKASGLLE